MIDAIPNTHQSRVAERLTGVDRVLATLKVLSGYPRGASLDDLARQLNAPKPSIHRALAALRRAQLVTQDERGHYRMSLEFIRLALEYYEALDERALVTPVLEAIAERFGETVHYGRLIKSEIVYVAKVTPQNQRVQMTSAIGGRNPAHCTGLGKMLLADALPDEESVERYVDEFGPLIKRTEQTLTTPRELASDLAQTRERGYALDNEESEPGVACIALPVFLASTSRPTGAISLTALTHRTPLSELVAAADELRGLIARHLDIASE